MRQAASDARLDIRIDSAGTGSWHVGAPPDPRAQATALHHGIDILHLRARQIEVTDYRTFSHIFALDRDNLRTLISAASANSTAEISFLLDCVAGKEGTPVADPYYGGDEGFQEAWADVALAAAALTERFSG
jgi:protein-tyrosine phosphatase